MTAPATPDEVESVFEKWGPTVKALPRLLPPHLDKWAIFDSYDHPAPFYARDRICIAGDAAHAASPHHGVEDALCLSTLLDLATQHHHRDLLQQQHPQQRPPSDNPNKTTLLHF
jgi:salicylate hydroxylase